MLVEISVANFLVNQMGDRIENIFIVFPYYIELGGFEITLDDRDKLEK